MTVSRTYVFTLRSQKPQQALPPNVENFLVELFQAPQQFNVSDEHENLRAATVSSWVFLFKVISIKLTRMATPLLVIFPRQ